MVAFLRVFYYRIFPVFVFLGFVGLGFWVCMLGVGFVLK